jgi:NAD+ kinase
MSNSKLKNIGLILKPNLIEAFPQVEIISSWIKKHSFCLSVDKKTKELLESIDVSKKTNHAQNAKIESISDLVSKCDVVITLGGDGTLIGAARLYNKSSKAIMLGVNFGTLGYLTEIKATELDQILPLVAENKAPIEPRSMIIGEVYDASNKKVFSAAALNDVVIVKGAHERLLKMNVKVNGNQLAEFRGDGIVLATPTGSTAYSMAAGGSIVYPSVPVTLLTPICPHALTIRPLILPSEQPIDIQIPEFGEEVFVTVDGQQTHHLQHHESIRVVKADYSVPLVRSPNRSYFDVLKTKLNWGIPNRAD